MSNFTNEVALNLSGYDITYGELRAFVNATTGHPDDDEVYIDFDTGDGQINAFRGTSKGD